MSHNSVSISGCQIHNTPSIVMQSLQQILLANYVCMFVLLAGIHSLTDSPVCLSTNRIFAYYRVVSKGKILLVQGRFPLSPLKEATQELLGESEANGASLQLGHGVIEEAIKVMESDVGVYKDSPVVKIEYWSQQSQEGGGRSRDSQWDMSSWPGGHQTLSGWRSLQVSQVMEKWRGQLESWSRRLSPYWQLPTTGLRPHWQSHTTGLRPHWQLHTTGLRPHWQMPTTGLIDMNVIEFISIPN